MKMYPSLDLYKYYLKHSCANYPLPDVTCKITLSRINIATNLCDIRGNFMDIGAGNGYNAIALSQIFEKGTIVEIDDAHEKIPPVYKKITVFNDFIENYTAKEEKFDFILLADIFEHIRDIENFVKKVSALQTETGVVYMMTPNPIFCGPATESELYFTKKTYGHIKHYTSQEIVSLMKKNGYELIFHFYEESHLRRELKNVVKGIARRDKRWSKNIIYKIIRPVVILFAKLLFKFIEYIVHRNEVKNSRNPFSTITQDLAFKKIK